MQNPTIDIASFDLDALALGAKHALWLDFAPRAGGGSWSLPVLAVCGANPGPTLVLFGAVHADEYDGPEVIHHLMSLIDPAELRGRLVGVPVCNVPAYEVGSRIGPIDHANLARVFPGCRTGTITQQIAYWLTEKFIRGAHMLIDIHSGGLDYRLPTLVGYISGDTPSRRASEAAAYAFAKDGTVPVIWHHPAPSPPGRSLSIADDLGVPALYTEAEGAGRVTKEVRERFSQGVLNVMRHMKMIDDAQRPAIFQAQPVPCVELVSSGDLDQIILAPCAGHFRSEVDLMQPVASGQRLGAIVDLLNNELAVIHADTDGIVVTLRGMYRVNAGDGLVHLAKLK